MRTPQRRPLGTNAPLVEALVMQTAKQSKEGACLSSMGAPVRLQFAVRYGELAN